MPPSASSKQPGFSLRAPVKAPFSWPKSSFSRISRGKAAQLMATKGPYFRVDLSWMARATSSLPVPLSPMMNMLALEGAAASIIP